MGFLVGLMSAGIRLAIPVGFGALGGMISERVGIVNMGLEGMMLMGSFFAVLGSYLTGSPYIGLLLAILIGAITGLVHAVLTIRYKCDHILSSLGINLFASGLTVVLLSAIWNAKGKSETVNGFEMIHIKFLEHVPVIGDLFGDISPMLILLIICTVSMQVMVFHTPLGLRIRVVGDDPAVADSLGISVYGIQYFGVILSGALAAIGGACLSIGDIDMFSKEMVSGRGYIAMAILVLGRWNPALIMVASLIFGILQGLQLRIQSAAVAPQLVQMIPYIATLIFLVISKSKNIGPQYSGKAYYRD